MATPPARGNDPRSPRTRSDRRLADPPTAEPSLSDIMAAVNYSRNETSSRLDEIQRTQVLHSSALSEVAKRTSHLEGMAKEQADATSALAARISELEKGGSRCASTASSVPSSASAAGRSGDPHYVDPNILRISAQSLVSKAAAEAALAPLYKAAKVDASKIRISGPAVGKAFILRPDLDADPGPASVVRRLMEARRDASGDWMQLALVGPAGERIPVFTDLDRSLAQRRVAWHLAQAKKVLLRFHPSLDVVLAKSEGLLTHNWRPLYSCRFHGEDRAVSMSWDRANLDKLGVDVDGITKALADHIAAADAERKGRRG